MTTLDDKIKSLEAELAIPVDGYVSFSIANKAAIKAQEEFNEVVRMINAKRDMIAVELLKLKEEKAREN